MRVIQAYWGKLKPEAKECMTKVKAMYPQVEVFSFPEHTAPSHESDVWRWNMFCENNDILYLDWDLYPLSKIDFPKDKISMSFLGRVPEFCFMYSPKKELFLEIEQDRIRRNIEQTWFAWDRKVFKGWRTKINKIDDNEFIHLRMTGLRSLKQQYKDVRRKQYGRPMERTDK